MKGADAKMDGPGIQPIEIIAKDFSITRSLTQLRVMLLLGSRLAHLWRNGARKTACGPSRCVASCVISAHFIGKSYAAGSFEIRQHPP
jgi:hypothetical protein